MLSPLKMDKLPDTFTTPFVSLPTGNPKFINTDETETGLHQTDNINSCTIRIVTVIHLLNIFNMHLWQAIIN